MSYQIIYSEKKVADIERDDLIIFGTLSYFNAWRSETIGISSLQVDVNVIL
jgi:hypothetical protein